MSAPIDLTALDDGELIHHTEAAIYESSFWAGRGGDHEDAHAACQAAYAECHRRQPNDRLYILAWNRASAGVCAPDKVPPYVAPESAEPTAA